MYSFVCFEDVFAGNKDLGRFIMSYCLWFQELTLFVSIYIKSKMC